MDKWIALNNQAAGRDKLARLVQYFSRAVWDYLEQKDCNPAIIDQFKTLEYILSSFRKLLRFGKCLDVFYSSLKAIHYPDLVIRTTITFSKLSQALFLLSDHILWLSRTGLFRNINSKKWSEVSNKYWLLSIIMNLSRDVYEIFQLIDIHKRTGFKRISVMNTENNGLNNISMNRILPVTCMSRKDISLLALHSYALLYAHRDVVIDTVKNLCDVFIPLTTLGYTKLTPKTIGILGVISSIAGLIAILEPNARLMPA